MAIGAGLVRGVQLTLGKLLDLLVQCFGGAAALAEERLVDLL